MNDAPNLSAFHSNGKSAAGRNPEEILSQILCQPLLRVDADVHQRIHQAERILSLTPSLLGRDHYEAQVVARLVAGCIARMTYDDVYNPDRRGELLARSMVDPSGVSGRYGRIFETGAKCRNLVSRAIDHLVNPSPHPTEQFQSQLRPSHIFYGLLCRLPKDLTRKTEFASDDRFELNGGVRVHGYWMKLIALHGGPLVDRVDQDSVRSVVEEMHFDRYRYPVHSSLETGIRKLGRAIRGIGRMFRPSPDTPHM